MNNEPAKQVLQFLIKIFNFIKELLTPLLALYHPENLKQQGMAWSVRLITVTVFVFIFLLALWWNHDPSVFDVQELAQEKAEDYSEKMVTGYVTTNTLIEVANTLLEKSGGYLSNDIMPPSIFMDDMPNWEWGVLQQIRDFSKALRNNFSRSRTQSEDPDLALAEPKFNTDNQSWFWPTSENKYQEGIDLLENYLHRLAAPDNKTAVFIVGSNNLRDWLGDVAKRLGNLSQRLSASVGQIRMSKNLAEELEEKTPWTKIDDVFYEARGTCWALIHFLRAVEIDFQNVLEQRQAEMTLLQIVRELEATQKMVWSPMILNGSEFGLFANHSLVLSSYLSRANTGIIELYNLLGNR